jgi:hypothetical protein
MAGEKAPGSGRAFPIGTIVLLAIAACFYVAMLLNIRSSSSGDAAVGDAIAWLFLTGGLWITLTIALVAGGVAGTMPRPAVWVLLQPLAGGAGRERRLLFAAPQPAAAGASDPAVVDRILRAVDTPPSAASRASGESDEPCRVARGRRDIGCVADRRRELLSRFNWAIASRRR